MTETEIALINALVSNKLSNDEFVKLFPEKLHCNYSYLHELIIQAMQRENGELLEYALVLGFRFDLFTVNDTDLYERLITDTWHTSHENLAILLKKIRANSSVDALYQAATLQLSYLDYDEGFELARKCVWALGEINSDAARNKLMLLTRSDNEIVSEYAQEQLRRLARSET